jgi:hypothetical protein
MDGERFDDVAYRFIDEPEPPRPRRPRRVRRWVAAAGVTAVVAGGLAAGASALTDNGGKAKAPSAANERAMPDAGWAAYAPLGHHCHHHQFRGGGANAPAGSNQ